jgi:hypothetical protein
MGTGINGGLSTRSSDTVGVQSSRTNPPASLVVPLTTRGAKLTVLSDLNGAAPSLASTTPSADNRWHTSHTEGIRHEPPPAIPPSPTT